jgi:glycosyltransferase involved in cell wall biosynthesis
MADSNPELLVVMPVYNEESQISTVLAEWREPLDACGAHYSILAIDDGSKDSTAAVLESIQAQSGGRIEMLRQQNAGHGPTILKGYRTAIERGVPWVFQIDSDGQCDPAFFAAMWQARDSSDIVAGYRAQRDDGTGRSLVSLILRVFLLVLFGNYCRDANVPYRLMRTEAIAPLVGRIPDTCGFTNVALSVLADRAGLRQTFLPIRFRARLGGESTVPYGKLGFKALELYGNLRDLLKK